MYAGERMGEEKVLLEQRSLSELRRGRPDKSLASQNTLLCTIKEPNPYRNLVHLLHQCPNKPSDHQGCHKSLWTHVIHTLGEWTEKHAVVGAQNTARTEQARLIIQSNTHEWRSRGFKTKSRPRNANKCKMKHRQSPKKSKTLKHRKKLTNGERKECSKNFQTTDE